MNQESDIFCSSCGNLFIRCNCEEKGNWERKKRDKTIAKKSVDFFKHIPKRFEFQYKSEIEGFRGYYEFYESKEKIFSFCNGIMNIPSGVLDKETVGELSLEYLNREITHPTQKTRVAKMYFPEVPQSQVGYALQNVFLFLASIDLATISRAGHGLKFKVFQDYWPEDYQPKKFDESLEYKGSTQGYKKSSLYHLYESNKKYRLFSSKRYDLITGTLKKKTVARIFHDYHLDEIDRVTTRIAEARKYFPNTDPLKVGFKFQNAFYVLSILGKARMAKIGRTIVFDIIESNTSRQ